MDALEQKRVFPSILREYAEALRSKLDGYLRSETKHKLDIIWSDCLVAVEVRVFGPEKTDGAKIARADLVPSVRHGDVPLCQAIDVNEDRARLMRSIALRWDAAQAHTDACDIIDAILGYAIEMRLSCNG